MKNDNTNEMYEEAIESGTKLDGDKQLTSETKTKLDEIELGAESDGDELDRDSDENVAYENNEPDMDEIAAAMEAILFTMGDAVDISAIASALQVKTKRIIECIDEMQMAMEQKNRGIYIIRLEDKVQLCTKKEMYEYLIRVAKSPRKNQLTDALLETLSIVAYKQPVTRVEIERVRGVGCDHVINKLIEYDLIKDIGRLDAPGRPVLFGTTEQFLRSFGMSGLDDLPEMNHDMIDDMKQQAEEEIQLKLNLDI